MNLWLLNFVSLAYLGTGVDYFLKGKFAWGVFWTSYAVANTCFLIATRP